MAKLTTAQSQAEFLRGDGAFAVPPVQPGTYLCAPSVYAPVSQTPLSVATSTFSVFSSSVSTGAFTAPASGTVIVTATFSIFEPTAASVLYSFGLGTSPAATTSVCNAVCSEVSSVAMRPAYSLAFYVTGLTPGNSYTLYLLGATANTADAIDIIAYGSTSPGTAGAPVIMTVQAV